VTDKDFPLISNTYLSLSFVAVYAIYKLHSTLFHTFLAVNRLTLRGCTQMYREISLKQAMGHKYLVKAQK